MAHVESFASWPSVAAGEKVPELKRAKGARGEPSAPNANAASRRQREGKGKTKDYELEFEFDL